MNTVCLEIKQQKETSKRAGDGESLSYNSNANGPANASLPFLLPQGMCTQPLSKESESVAACTARPHLLMAATRLSRVSAGLLMARMPSFSFSSRCFSNLQETEQSAAVFWAQQSQLDQCQLDPADSLCLSIFHPSEQNSPKGRIL